jgi:hypothetical protein
MKKNLYVFRGMLLLVAILMMTVSQAVFALPQEDSITSSQNPGNFRGPVRTMDDECTWDYDGMKFLGTGGVPRGYVFWPNGSFSGNYGEMRFVRDCDSQIDTTYAFCFDIDHALEDEPYCVELDYSEITDDSCSAIQLRATAYILAWSDAQNAYEDDIDQLALWKLATNYDIDDPNYGIPYFCIDSSNAVDPNPSYPYINTVFCSISSRNNNANLKVLDALDKNVMLNDDIFLISNDPAVVGPTHSVITVQACVFRGTLAGEVGNNSLENIRVLATYSIGGGAPTEMELFTDAAGCVSFDISQPINDNSYEDVEVKFCSNAVWPKDGIPCTLTDKQLLVLGDPVMICDSLDIPGDQWLPVELTAFDAYNSNEGVDLVWTTASEIDIDRWEIERTLTGTGEFTVLARIQASNSLAGSNYTYHDRLGVNGRTYDYRLVDVGMDGTRTTHETVATAAYGSFGSGSVTEYELGEAYPNPFNPSATIRYSIPDAGLVKITVYDVNGREVAQLVNNFHEAGRYAVKFDGSNLSSGTYFYRMTSAEFSITKRMMLLK